MQSFIILTHQDTESHKISRTTEQSSLDTKTHRHSRTLQSGLARSSSLLERRTPTDWLAQRNVLSAGRALLLSWLSLADHQLFKYNNEKIHIRRMVNIILLFECHHLLKLDPDALTKYSFHINIIAIIHCTS